jgi:hypothetical protein
MVMKAWRKMIYRFRALLGSERLDREMDEEIRFHLEMQMQQNIEAGMALPSTALVPAVPARGAGKMPTDGGDYSLRDGWWHCDMCGKWAWG